MPRFSLRFLLIGVAVLSVLLAVGSYIGRGIYLSLEAENNLQAYCLTADTLADFVDQRGRWPRDERELASYADGPANWPANSEYALARTIVAYDFDVDRDSLDPAEFRGLRYREPSFRSDHFRDRLIASLAELRLRRSRSVDAPTSSDSEPGINAATGDSLPAGAAD